MMSGYTQPVLIDLIDPIITTSTATSAGTPDALRYIPGSMLHGAAASNAYSSGCSKPTAFSLFHDGSVRFSDGLPIDRHGAIGWPVPKSLQRRKTESAWLSEENRAFTKLGPGVVDRTHTDQDGTQWKPVIADGITRDEVRVSVSRYNTMRTAINPDERRAAENQLFGYEFLAPPQSFIAFLESSDSELLKKAAEFLLGERIFGRSKSAEYGRVRISRIDDFKLSSVPSSGEVNYVWCLSDLWTDDSVSGGPLPNDQTFGAPIDWSRSFALTRRISPFNAKWRHRGIEREVIQRGSVFALKTASSSLSAGFDHICFGQEFGSGWIIAHSAEPRSILHELAGFVPQFKAPIHAPEILNMESINRGLSSLLQRRAAGSIEVGPANLVSELVAHYEAAKKWNGKHVGPTASQWGSLRSVLEANGNLNRVLGEADERKERLGWNSRFSSEHPGTFAEWVREKLQSPSEKILPIVARDIRSKLKSGGVYNDE